MTSDKIEVVQMSRWGLQDFNGRRDGVWLPAPAWAEVVEALREAAMQLEYLDEKFQQTGTTAAVLARNEALLKRLGV